MSLIEKAFGGVSTLKLTGYFLVLLLAAGGYHALTVYKLRLGTAQAEKHAQELSTALETARGDLKSERQQRQGVLNELAGYKKEVKKWKKAYEVDTGLCKTLYGSVQAEADRRKVNVQKLEEYAKKTPSVKDPLDPEFTKLLNGETP